MTDSTAGQTLLASAPTVTCPACEQTLPALVIPEWDTTPTACTQTPQGNLRLNGKHIDGHPVAVINGQRLEEPRLVAHAFACPANGIYGRFQGPGMLMLLEDEQYPRPLPVKVLRRDYRPGQHGHNDLITRCLLTGHSQRLAGDGRRRGERINPKQWPGRTGIPADIDGEALHPLVTVAAAAADMKLRSPHGLDAWLTVQAGLSDRDRDAEVAFWWTQAVGLTAAEIRDGTYDPRHNRPGAPADAGDPIALLLAVWHWRLTDSVATTEQVYARTNATVDLIAGRSHAELEHLAGLTPDALAHLRDVHTAAAQTGEQALMAWQQTGVATGVGSADQPTQLALL